MHYYYSGLRRYVQQLGLGNAKRLILSGAMIEAPEMLQIGFLDELLAPDALHARVVVLAGMIADGAPTAVQGMKASMNAIAAGTAVAQEVQDRYLSSLRSDDLKEGLRALAEKRKPRFTEAADL